MNNSINLQSQNRRARIIFLALCSILLVNVWIGEISAQVIRVNLTSTKSIGPPGGHISVLSSDVPLDYIIQVELQDKARFFKLDHGVLVTTHASGQWLIFDSDDDKIFSDSDPRFFFPNKDRELTVALPNDERHVSIPSPNQELTSSSSAKQPRVDSGRFSIQRQPDLPDSLLALAMDDAGNLVKPLTRAWSLLLSDTSFHGKAGTFYFTDWLTARTGILSFNGHTLDVGVQLQSQSKSFDDSSSYLLIDANRDHKFNNVDDLEYFPVYRPFSLANKYLRASKVDALGRWLEFTEIDSNLARADALRWPKKSPEVRGVLIPDSTLKKLTLTSVTGEQIRLESLGNRSVLLNFWGEWCAPCIREIPTLVEAHSKYGKKDLTIIGLLKTEDVEKALALASSHNMSWPQVRLTDSLAKYFGVMLYPTNLLIHPGGEFVVRTLNVTPEWFDEQLSPKLR